LIKARIHPIKNADSDELKGNMSLAWPQHRFAIINVWRSIAGPVLNSPLACCDAQTIDATDLVASERRAKERIGELELVSWNPARRPAKASNRACWYFFHKAKLLRTAFLSPAPCGQCPQRPVRGRLLS
jgi:hypothetical protein